MSSSEDLFHIRGDRASGTGFTYEALWRTRLLVGLADDDVLAVFQGHDIRIMRGSGLLEFYQVKYKSTLLDRDDVDRLVRDAEKAATNERYILCTNASPSRATDTLLEPLRKRRVLRVETWTPHSDDATSELDTAVRKKIKECFPTRDPSDYLTDRHVMTIVSAALSLASHLPLRTRPQVSGREFHAEVGLPTVVQSISTLATGGRLRQWDASSNDLVEIPQFLIRRSLENAVDQEIERWIARPTSRVVVIHGMSGAGKTSLLAAIAQRYSSRAPIYWDAPTTNASPPALGELAQWTRVPTIVCVDDYLPPEWFNRLRALLSAQANVLVVVTTSQTSDAEALADVSRDARVTVFELGPTLDYSEQQSLLLTLRGKDSYRSHREGYLLAASTIRRAVRILTALPTDARQNNKLVGLTRQGHLRPWLMPILIASSVHVDLPQSLLLSHVHAGVGQTLPSELEPFILRRCRNQEHLLRIDDTSVAVRVLSRLAREIGPTFDNGIVEEVVHLVGNAAAQESSHRVFVRRLLWALSASEVDRASLATATSFYVRRMLASETNVDVAMAWLGLLTRQERHEAEHQLVTSFLSSTRVPQSVAEVRLLVEALGPKIARRYAEHQLQGGLQWPLRPWAGFFVKLAAMPRADAKLPSRRALALFRRTGLSLTGLFEFGSAAIVLGAIEDHGAPLDREWALEVLEPWLKTSAPNPALLPAFQKYLPLVERTLMQPRAGVSIALVSQALVMSGTESFVSLAESAYDRYRELRVHEQDLALAGRAIELGLALTHEEIDSTKRQLTLLSQLISFSSAWAPDDLMRKVLACARNFLSERADLLKPAENLILACAAESGRRGLTSRDDLETWWRLIAAIPESPVAWRLVSWLSVGLLKTGAATNEALIKSFVSALAQTRLREAAQLLPGLLSVLGQTDEVAARVKGAMRDIAGELEKREASVLSVVITAWGGARQLAWTPQEAADMGRAMTRWTETPRAQEYLPLTLDKIGAFAALGDFVAKAQSIRPENPDVNAYACVVAARKGDLELAKFHARWLLQSFRRDRVGAHLESLTRAYDALASACDESESVVWRFCAMLTDRRPLSEHVSV